MINNINNPYILNYPINVYDISKYSNIQTNIDQIINLTQLAVESLFIK